MHSHNPTTCLLAWGGAPGTTSDGLDFDCDAPARSFTTDAGDDADNDEHFDL